MININPERTGGQLTFVASGGLGDALLLSPFLKAYHKSGRYSRIRVVINRAAVQLYDRSPYANQIIGCDGDDLFLWAIPDESEDLFAPYIDVEDGGGIREVAVTVTPVMSPNLVQRPVMRQIAEMAALPLSDEELTMEIFTSTEDEAEAERLLGEDHDMPTVYLNTRSNFPEKEYPIGHWATVIDALAGKVRFVTVGNFGGGIEKVEQISDSVDLHVLAEIVRRVDLVVTIDSFPHHLAQAVGTFCVTIFGASNPATFGHQSHFNLRSDICEPCADMTRRLDCKDYRCLTSLAPEAVITKISQTLEPASALPERRL